MPKKGRGEEGAGKPKKKPAEKLNIETTADHLMALVAKKKRISIPSAAKQLAMPEELVEEWAQFLEQEGYIKIEYGFSKAYLKYLDMPPEELGVRTHAVDLQRKNLVRKIDVELDKLDDDMEFVAHIREMFNELIQKLEKNDEIAEKIRRFEEIQRVDSQAEDASEQVIASLRAELAEIETAIKEYEGRYDTLMKDVTAQHKTLDAMKQAAETTKQIEEYIEKHKGEVKQYTEEAKNAAEETARTKEALESLEKQAKDIRGSSEHALKEIRGAEEVSEKTWNRLSGLLAKRLQSMREEEEQIQKHLSKQPPQRSQEEPEEEPVPEQSTVDVLLERVERAEHLAVKGEKQEATRMYNELRDAYKDPSLSSDDRTRLYNRLITLYYHLSG